MRSPFIAQLMLLSFVVAMTIGHVSAVHAASLEDTILASNPVVYYRLDETDKSNGQTAANLGSAADGTYVASVQNVTDPLPTIGGNAAGFDATGNDRVRLSSLASFPTTQVTATTWVRGDAAANSEATIYSYDVSGQGNEFLLINQSGKWRIFVDGTTAITSVTEAEVLDGDWHHIAVTWDSTTGDANFYLDAVLQDTVNLEMGTSLATGGTLVLGQEQDGLDTGYNASQRLIGDLDEFALFNTVLTQDQITAQFNAALAVPEPATIAIWSLLGIGLAGFGIFRARRRR